MVVESRVENGALVAAENIASGDVICTFENSVSDLPMEGITNATRLKKMLIHNPSRDPRFAIRLNPVHSGQNYAAMDAFYVASAQTMSNIRNEVTLPASFGRDSEVGHYAIPDPNGNCIVQMTQRNAIIWSVSGIRVKISNLSAFASAIVSFVGSTTMLFTVNVT